MADLKHVRKLKLPVSCVPHPALLMVCSIPLSSTSDIRETFTVLLFGNDKEDRKSLLW